MAEKEIKGISIGNSDQMWPEGILKAWVCYELFRMLGFDDNQISVGAVTGTAYGTMTKVVRIQLDAQGKTFGIHAAIWTKHPDEFVELWDKFGDRLVGLNGAKKFDENELQTIFSMYEAEFPIKDLALALVSKGIIPPEFEKVISKVSDQFESKRSPEQAIAEHSRKIADIVSESVSMGLKPKDHIAIFIEKESHMFDKAVQALKISEQDQSKNDYLGVVVERSAAVLFLEMAGVDVPHDFLEDADGRRAMPVVLCCKEGAAYSLAGEVRKPS